MNAKLLVAAVLTIAAGAAVAQSAPQAQQANAVQVAAATAVTAAAPGGPLHAAAPVQLTRAQVKAEVIEARKNGTLIETEADMDVAQTRKHMAR